MQLPDPSLEIKGYFPAAWSTISWLYAVVFSLGNCPQLTRGAFPGAMAPPQRQCAHSDCLKQEYKCWSTYSNSGWLRRAGPISGPYEETAEACIGNCIRVCSNGRTQSMFHLSSRPTIVGTVVGPISPNPTNFPIKAIQNPGGAIPRLDKFTR